ncbi:MAG: MBL fold metallo-hydrolase [Kiritimatiellae bacterium]|nr:MBL fold metallo-hydrolase [Kiritimatiellia bacterium]
MKIETIVVGEFAVNCFVCTGTDSQALVIDPGEDAHVVVAHLKEQGLNVAAYLMTHGHCDHISGLAAVHDAFPAPVAMHPTDWDWAFTQANTLPPFFCTAPRRPDSERVDLVDGSSYTYAGLTFSIIDTPGHTPGGVCIYFETEATLITGDTLFADSVGRTDLHGGDSRVLAASLKKLKTLPDQTTIFPGHGPSSTIGQEKRTNYFMQG